TFGAWAALHSDQHQAEIAQDIQGHSVRLQRSMALREDIRDLRKLEQSAIFYCDPRRNSSSLNVPHAMLVAEFDFVHRSSAAVSRNSPHFDDGRIDNARLLFRSDRFTEGYPPPDAISAWADIWMFNIAWSICLTFLSIWLASVYQ
ncbi:hypothetical protein FOZ63_019774, partial [Perkinsus olseni]